MKTLFISDSYITFARRKGSKDKSQRKKKIGLGTALAGSAVVGGSRGALVTHMKYRKGFQLVLANNEANLAKAIKAGNPHANIIYPGKKKLKEVYMRKLIGRAGKGALASATLTGLGYGAYSLISKKAKEKQA